MKTEPVVLFGAGGFVGGHLRRRLESEGIEVRVPIDSTGRRIDIAGPVHLIRQAIGNAQVVVNAAGRAHLHTQNPSAFWPANAIGAWHIAEAATSTPSVRRLIHVSSVAVGAGGVKPAAAEYQPHNAYGASKAAGEIGVATAMKRSGADLVIVRPAGVGGIDSPGSWGRIRRMVQAGKLVPVPNNEVRHDVVEIHDVVTLLLEAVRGRLPAGVHSLAGPRPVTLAEYALRVSDEIGEPAHIIRVPELILRTAGAASSLALRVTKPANRVEQLVSTLTRQRPLVIESTPAQLS